MFERSEIWGSMVGDRLRWNPCAVWDFCLLVYRLGFDMIESLNAFGQSCAEFWEAPNSRIPMRCIQMYLYGVGSGNFGG